MYIKKNMYIFLGQTRTPITLIITQIKIWGLWEVIYYLTPPWNPNSNPMYILKKYMYILKKNVYILFRANRDPNDPYYVLNS